MKRIVFTGGGTAGHVNPNLALIEVLQKDDWEIHYIGSETGIEKEMIHSIQIPFHPITCGKFRRYFSWKNFIDPFKILIGCMQAYCILGKIKADVVFSKGGFVAFPVVLAAWLRKIPIIAHESDLSPGLANRLCFPFVNKICITFEGAKNFFKNTKKIAVTGTPIRSELFKGSKQKGLELCGFNEAKPCLLIMGGSQGSIRLNKIIRVSLNLLQNKYQIIHLCGKGNIDKQLHMPGYYQVEYAKETLADLFAASDIIISRAGANALYEILALEKPHVLIPLSLKASRGDQIQNALYFKEQGISHVIEDEMLTKEILLEEVEKVYNQKASICNKIKDLAIQSSSLKVIAVIEEEMDVRSPKAV